MTEEQQSANAIRFYDSKSFDYDATWHNDFTRRFISYLDIQPGQHILDLACGTGLLTFREADTVGPEGQVVGVDVTPGMLAVAAQRQKQGGDKYSNITFLEGDVLHMGEIEQLKGKQFDVITVASALVLFPDPKAAIEHWTEFLKPGGVIAMDATHPRNLISGMVLERVARRLDLPIPYNRSWSKSEDTLKQTLESAGLEVDEVFTVENQAGYGKRSYEMEQWDDFFVENVIVKDVARTFANNDIRRKAQGVYKEEWEKLAIDGKVEEVDAVFLGIARRRKYSFQTKSSDDRTDNVFSRRRFEILAESRQRRCGLQRGMSLRWRAIHIECPSIRYYSLPLSRMPASLRLRLSSLHNGSRRRPQIHTLRNPEDFATFRCRRANVLLGLWCPNIDDLSF
jgi:ubiquinone/menaquinone biosynthesis C-methylase UbiE